MILKNLFNIRVPVHTEMKDADAASYTKMVGVMTARQSAVTFAGAPVFVTLVWKVLGAAIPALAASKLCAVVLSVFVGIAIYAASETPGGTFREKMSGYFFAFINSFAIAGTVLGIDTTLATVALVPGG